jgi:hypothetical protein
VPRQFSATVVPGDRAEVGRHAHWGRVDHSVCQHRATQFYRFEYTKYFTLTINYFHLWPRCHHAPLFPPPYMLVLHPPPPVPTASLAGTRGHVQWSRRAYNGHVQWSRTVVTYSGHVQWSRTVVTYSGHVQWSRTVVTYSGHVERHAAGGLVDAHTDAEVAQVLLDGTGYLQA